MSNFIGAIAGDVFGSPYEWHNEKNKNNIDLLNDNQKFTDDTVLTLAIANWLIKRKESKLEDSRKILENSLQRFGDEYPNAGYGHMFRDWLKLPMEEKKGLNSFGNGAGMRVSAVGYFADSIEECLDLAKKSAEVTHNHPEGIKGAQCIALGVYLSRDGYTKEDIIAELTKRFGYELKLNEHKFDATCQTTVPEALYAFQQGDDFEDVMYNAIAIGGDSDTIACMAGALAGAYYGVPSWISERVIGKLSDGLRKIFYRFEKELSNKKR